MRNSLNKINLELINREIDEHISAINTIKKQTTKIENIYKKIIETIKNKKKIYICGNGGSAADSQHFASELVGRYEKNRDGFSAISLTTDSSALTAISNDYGFENVFSRQIESLGNVGDLLIVLSTSGNSENIISAVKAANKKGIFTIGILGKNGGKLLNLTDLNLVVDEKRTCRIQEVHALLIHILCELIDNKLDNL